MEFVLIYIIGVAISLAILYAVIRAAVRMALMDHYEAVQRLEAADLNPPSSAPAAPLKWWQR